ncbi:MAG TPA: DUF1127 domain-containing protein [Dongiaceae bacterium]|jgi:uncharacterized protein YjiS (DUF1127 family)|nr:DUF1127 domain-containing protein [Dongiaceae bacterium]
MSQLISRRSNSLQLQAQSEPSFGWIGEVLSAIPRALRRAWAVQAEEKLLQELSDHQLRDLGIKREQISHIVRYGWDR